MKLVITSIIRDDKLNKAFGFATNMDGVEYFIPRATILIHDMTYEDVGGYIEAKVSPNPKPVEGKVNYSHVSPEALEFLDA